MESNRDRLQPSSSGNGKDKSENLKKYTFKMKSSKDRLQPNSSGDSKNKSDNSKKYTVKMESSKEGLQPNSSGDCKNKNNDPKKYAFYRKPSIKKKAPEVKQTLTSMKRMMQANPLLKYEREGIPVPSFNTMSRQNSKNDLNKIMQPPSCNAAGKKTMTNNSSKPCAIVRLAGNEPNPHAKLMCLNSARLSSVNFNETEKILSSTVLENCSVFESEPKTKPKPPPMEHSKIKAVTKNSNSIEKSKKNISNLKQKEINGNGVRRSKSLVLKGDKKPRRSLSAQHYDRKTGLSNAQGEETEDCLQAAHSLENISTPIPVRTQHKFSPIAEVSQEGKLVFKTPSAYERRSVYKFTPRSVNMSRRSIYQSTSDLPSLDDLQKRLNDWLIKRGKSVSLFSDLKRFQSPQVIDEENKENIEVDANFDKSSYEDLRIVQTKDDDEKAEIEILDSDNLEQVAKAALVDLNHLIKEGYPVQQCEGWLEVIKTKYGKLPDEPEYWECRAAIEQSRGNITNAVDCYRTAIVQGAEVQEVDKSLDILLQKFSLLNITTNNSESERMTRERARIVQDARNVFKSSIIKFAVQEKKLKRNGTQPKLMATPVRRSTRLSRSTYTSTPGVKVCYSLLELDSPDRANLDFRNNKAFV